MDTHQPEIERLPDIRYGWRVIRPDYWIMVPVAEAAPGRSEAPEGPAPLPWWFRLLVVLGIMRR